MSRRIVAERRRRREPALGRAAAAVGAAVHDPGRRPGWRPGRARWPDPRARAVPAQLQAPASSSTAAGWTVERALRRRLPEGPVDTLGNDPQPGGRSRSCSPPTSTTRRAGGHLRGRRHTALPHQRLLVGCPDRRSFVLATSMVQAGARPRRRRPRDGVSRRRRDLPIASLGLGRGLAARRAVGDARGYRAAPSPASASGSARACSRTRGPCRPVASDRGGSPAAAARAQAAAGHPAPRARPTGRRRQPRLERERLGRANATPSTPTVAQQGPAAPFAALALAEEPPRRCGRGGRRACRRHPADRAAVSRAAVRAGVGLVVRRGC
jgi:hypothetical protein